MGARARHLARMRLALESLRGWWFDTADVPPDLYDAVVYADGGHDGQRRARARVALYLRAYLRAEAGDCGGLLIQRARCRVCAATHPTPWTPDGDAWTKRHMRDCGDHPFFDASRRITPLWEKAPPHARR